MTVRTKYLGLWLAIILGALLLPAYADGINMTVGPGGHSLSLTQPGETVTFSFSPAGGYEFVDGAQWAYAGAGWSANAGDSSATSFSASINKTGGSTMAFSASFGGELRPTAGGPGTGGGAIYWWANATDTSIAISPSEAYVSANQKTGQRTGAAGATFSASSSVSNPNYQWSMGSQEGLTVTPALPASNSSTLSVQVPGNTDVGPRSTSVTVSPASSNGQLTASATLYAVDVDLVVNGAEEETEMTSGVEISLGGAVNVGYTVSPGNAWGMLSLSGIGSVLGAYTDASCATAAYTSYLFDSNGSVILKGEQLGSTTLQLTYSTADGGIFTDSAAVTVVPASGPQLTLSLDPTSVETSVSAVTVTVARNPSPQDAPSLDVGLSLSPSNCATFGTAGASTTVAIPAGASSASATISIPSDYVRDYDQTVSVTASCTGYQGDTKSFVIKAAADCSCTTTTDPLTGAVTCLAPGAANQELGSLRATFPVGKGLDGHTLGRLVVKQDRFSEGLYFPSSLQFTNIERDGMRVVRGKGSVLRQVITDKNIMNIVPNRGRPGYEVQYYPPQALGAKTQDGTYALAGQPKAVMKVGRPDKVPAGMQVVSFALTEDGQERPPAEFTWDEKTQTWQLAKNGRTEFLRTEEDKAAGLTRKTRGWVLTDGKRQVTSIETRKKFPWGERKIEFVDDPDGQKLVTHYDYYDDVKDKGNYGQLKEEYSSLGNWTRYFYDAQGRKSKVRRQFLDAPRGSEDQQSRVTLYAYAPVAPGDRPGTKLAMPRLVVEQLLGIEIARTYRVYLPGEEREIRCASADAAWDAPSNLVTVTRTFVAGEFQGKTRSVTTPDGSLTLYTYERQGNGGLKTVVERGIPAPHGESVATGERTVTLADKWGGTLSTYTYDIATGALTNGLRHVAFDSEGRPTRTEYFDGTFSEETYGCCGVERRRDRDGRITTSVYDSYKRLASSTDTATGLTTLHQYDPQGNHLQTTTVAANGEKRESELALYDSRGEYAGSRDQLGNETRIQKGVDAEGHPYRETIRPDGTTVRELSYQDGSDAGKTGTGVWPVRIEFGIDPRGPYTRVTRLDAQGKPAEWTRSYQDFLGRGYLIVNAAGEAHQEFDAQGRLARSIDADGVTTLAVSSADGLTITTAQDLNRNGIIDYEGPDRVSRQQSELVWAKIASDGTPAEAAANAAGAEVLRRTRTWTWDQEGNAEPRLQGATYASLDGRRAWSASYPVAGAPRWTRSLREQSDDGVVLVTVWTPDGLRSVAKSQWGRQLEEARYDAKGILLSSRTFGDDAFGRNVEVRSRQGDLPVSVTRTEFDAAGRVLAVTTDPDDNGPLPARRTAYEYDRLGRTLSQRQPDGELVHYEYLPTGELGRTWGGRNYPVAYGYGVGRLTSLTTWQDFAAATGAATTTWHYDESGRLDRKTYADGQGPSYSYTPAGRLATRTWARGVETRYGYDAAGSLGEIIYSDTTPAVRYEYTRAGAQRQAVSGAGTLVLTYDADGRLAGEAWSAGPLAGLHLAQAYNGQGKRQLLTLGSRDREWGRSDFGYDAQGRLATVASGTVSAHYEYSAAKARLPDLHVQNAQGREVLRTTRAYDALDRLVRIDNASLAPDGAATILSSHEYVTNDAGQRLKSTLADGSYWLYSYDPLGQVTGGVKYTAAGQELPGQRFDYRFDDIGNRQSATIPTVGAGTTPRPDLGSQTTYRSNLLNQYTQIQLGPQVSPLTYDADGNLLTDGRWRYTWDAENRLLAVESIPNVGAGTTPRLRLLYTYDHQSRRLQRREFTWNKTHQNWTAATDTRYLYDGWNCVAEFDGSGALQARYVWGLDLSGSEQGAGGVGGLLFGIWSSPSFQGPVSSFYCYDGNGNVVALASAADGTPQARYDYAPFGETVSAEDVAASNRGTEAAPTLGLAAQNSYRFSTKPQDPVSHLYYYGYRWYSPDLGRWLSRDPIGEKGDVGIYVAAMNRMANRFDHLGMLSVSVTDNVIVATPSISRPVYRQCLNQNTGNTHLELIGNVALTLVYVDASFSSSVPAETLTSIYSTTPGVVPPYNVARTNLSAYAGAGFVAVFQPNTLACCSCTSQGWTQYLGDSNGTVDFTATTSYAADFPGGLVGSYWGHRFSNNYYRTLSCGSDVVYGFSWGYTVSSRVTSSTEVSVTTTLWIEM